MTTLFALEPQDDLARAIAIVRRSLDHLREHARHEVPSALGVLGAALRMAGGRALERSLAAFDAGIEAAEALPDERRTTALRWLRASRSTPSAVLGRWDDARRDVSAAKEMVMEDATAVVETLLLEVRVLLGRGHVTLASERLEAARARVGDALPWVQGWLPRYEADVLAAQAGGQPDGGAAQAYVGALGTAWESNAGFGFQRRLILSRIAGVSVDFEGRWTHAVTRSIALEVGALHRDRLGLRLEDCPRCRDGSVQVRVVHALGLTTAAAMARYR